MKKLKKIEKIEKALENGHDVYVHALGNIGNGFRILQKKDVISQNIHMMIWELIMGSGTIHYPE